jgi:hypothetical protein
MSNKCIHCHIKSWSHRWNISSSLHQSPLLLKYNMTCRIKRKVTWSKKTNSLNLYDPLTSVSKFYVLNRIFQNYFHEIFSWVASSTASITQGILVWIGNCRTTFNDIGKLRSVWSLPICVLTTSKFLYTRAHRSSLSSS